VASKDNAASVKLRIMRFGAESVVNFQSSGSFHQSIVPQPAYGNRIEMRLA
jgi:hypothetical protein